MYFPLRQTTLVLCGLLLTAAQAIASQAGWRQITVPGTTPDAAPIVVALYYPTQAPARTFAGDSAEAPWQVAPPRVPGAGFTPVAPPAPNRFVLMPLALLGTAAIGVGAAFTGFSIVSRV